MALKVVVAMSEGIDSSVALVQKSVITGKIMKNERPPKAVREAFKALQIAVAKALADHKRTGDPIFIWEKGKVVRIPPNRIRISKIFSSKEIA